MTGGAALIHTVTTTVIMQDVPPVPMFVALGPPSALIVTAAGMNTAHEEVRAAVLILITDAETTPFVRGLAPMNPMTIGTTMREVRSMGVDMPMTLENADEVSVL